MDSATSQALPTHASMGITQAVLLEVIVHGPIARSTIANRLGRSQARVSRVVTPLIRSGLLQENQPDQDDTSGRPLVPLTVNPEALLFLGVKLTAECAYAVVVDLAGEIRMQWDEPLGDTAQDHVVDLVGALLRQAEDEFGAVEAIGITLGGHTADQRVVRHASFLDWDEVPLAELVEQRTGKQTAVENDVRALTLTEHWFGEGRGRSSFAIITLGAGIALGIVSGNTVITGSTSFAGAIGHYRVLGSATQCELGHVGCARALLSTPFLEQLATETLGRTTTLEELLEAAARGDLPNEVLRPSGNALGQIIGTVTSMLDPGLIIISGEGAAIARVAADAVQAGMETTAHWAAPKPELAIAGFDFLEWARGAAVVAMQTALLGGTLPDILDRLNQEHAPAGTESRRPAQLRAVNE